MGGRGQGERQGQAKHYHIVTNPFGTLVRSGEAVKMSTRRATYVTLDELIDEVGAMRPAARWSVRGVDVAEPGAAVGLCCTGRQGAPV